MSSPEVVAVGSAVLDHIYTLSNLPEPDGGAFAHEHTTDVGGVAANVASGIAEFGNETGIIAVTARKPTPSGWEEARSLRATTHR